MMKPLLLLLFYIVAIGAFSQTSVFTPKECRIAAGAGIANATRNAQTVGPDVWMQLSYTLLEHVSVATEFEDMGYKQPGFFKDLPAGYDEIHVADNSFSLLLKYGFPIRSALKIAVATGWTFAIRQSKYYVLQTDSTMRDIQIDQSSYSNYGIPFLVEVNYPLSKTIQVPARAKYNLISHYGSTYATGVGLSIRL